MAAYRLLSEKPLKTECGSLWLFLLCDPDASNAWNNLVKFNNCIVVVLRMNVNNVCGWLQCWQLYPTNEIMI